MVTGGPTAGPGAAPCVVTPAPTPPPSASHAATSPVASPDGGGGSSGGGGPVAVQRRSASETRRSNKPIMEKRRRARINNCLNELKTLILDAMKKDPARHSKLEKADILEMTVKHLETLQRQQTAMAAATDPAVVNKFRAGFSECAGEVGRFPGLDAPVRRRLLAHLASCLNGTALADQHQAAPAAPQPPPAAPTATAVQVHIVPAAAPPSDGSGGAPLLLTTTAGAVTAGGLQLVPTRLPNGDIALVLPRSQQQPLPQQTPPQQQQPPQAAPSPTPLPTLVPIPTRTASTASAASTASSSSSSSGCSSGSGSPSSSSSPVAFERLGQAGSPQPAPTAAPAHHAPPPAPASPVVLCRDVATSPAHVYYQPRPYSPPMQKPLSLVVRKAIQPAVEEEKPWRPW